MKRLLVKFSSNALQSRDHCPENGNQSIQGEQGVNFFPLIAPPRRRSFPEARQ
jgi:hypothetical protein